MWLLLYFIICGFQLQLDIYVNLTFIFEINFKSRKKRNSSSFTTKSWKVQTNLRNNDLIYRFQLPRREIERLRSRLRSIFGEEPKQSLKMNGAEHVETASLVSLTDDPLLLQWWWFSDRDNDKSSSSSCSCQVFFSFSVFCWANKMRRSIY